MSSPNRSLLSTILVLAPLAMAQSTSVDVVFFGYDSQPPLDASVVGVGNSATTLSIACAPGPDPENADDCGVFPYQTLTYGASTYKMDISADGITGTQDCSFSNAAAPITAVCVESYSGVSANFPGISTETYTDGTTYPISVTAGASLLNGVAPATTTATTTSTTGHTAITTSYSGTTSPAVLSTGTSSGASSGSGSMATSATSATHTGAANSLVRRESYGIVGALAGLMGVYLF